MTHYLRAKIYALEREIEELEKKAVKEPHNEAIYEAAIASLNGLVEYTREMLLETKKYKIVPLSQLKPSER